jgi:molecular chaperone HscB
LTEAGPPSFGPDPFVVFGIDRRFAVDREALETLYRKLARQAHPDRFVRADARTRRLAMQRAVELNDAWRIIKDPVARAEALLLLRGVDVSREGGAVRVGGDDPGAPIRASQDLLMEMMEKNEAVAEARAAGDQRVVESIAREAHGRIDALMASVADQLDAAGPVESIAQDLMAVRYWRRLLEDVEGQHG